jgi:hypothetical protein
MTVCTGYVLASGGLSIVYVAFDLPKKCPPIEPPDFAQREVCQSFQLPSSCTDSSECSDNLEDINSVIHMVCALRAVCWFMSVMSAK